MSDMTYNKSKKTNEKPIVWLHGEVKAPPFSKTARLEAGYLLRQLQKGLTLECLLHAQCRLLGKDAMKLESTIKNQVGE